MGRLLVVRHGESEGNRLRQFSVDNDIDLTDLGVEQARAAGRAIGAKFSPTRIVASPYHRTRRTAALIAETLGHSGEIALVHELREREIGELAGAPYTAMRDHPDFDPERFWDWRPRDGESLADVVIRAAPVIDGLCRGGEDVVVVTHGGVMLALRAHVEGAWNQARVSRNCEVMILSPDESGRLVVDSLEPQEAGVEPPDGGATG